MPPDEKKRRASREVDNARMSFGEHLEELRKRIIWALVGLVVAAVACFTFGETIILYLTAPYKVAMEEAGLEAQLIQLNPAEAFVEYFKITLKLGFVLAAPWILYQVWQFVAAGLYPAEQILVRRFAPTSIALFLVGASFMLVVVLKGLMAFLIGVSTWFPLPDQDNWLYCWLKAEQAPSAAVATRPAADPVQVPIMAADPEQPVDGQIWVNVSDRLLKFRIGEDTFGQPLQKLNQKQFVQPFFSVAEYLGFVVNLALAFGLGFQIPIVVIFLVTLRIVTAAQMSAARKYVILGVAVLSAILTPSPDVTTMLLLAVPMLLLFEAGLAIGRFIERRKAQAAPPTGPMSG